MKHLSAFVPSLLILLAALSGITVASADDKPADLVIFFSLDDQMPPEVDAMTAATGKDFNTAVAASYLAKKLNADLVRITSSVSYPASMSAAISTFQEQKADGETPEISLKPDSIRLDSYRHVYLGYPVWLNGMPGEIRAFVTENTEELKKTDLAIFNTTDASDSRPSVTELAEMLGQESLSSVCLLSGSHQTFQQDLDSWLLTTTGK